MPTPTCTRTALPALIACRQLQGAASDAVFLTTALSSASRAGGFTVPRGQDVMISVYNIHRSPAGEPLVPADGVLSVCSLIWGGVTSMVHTASTVGLECFRFG